MLRVVSLFSALCVSSLFISPAWAMTSDEFREQLHDRFFARELAVSEVVERYQVDEHYGLAPRSATDFLTIRPPSQNYKPDFISAYSDLLDEMDSILNDVQNSSHVQDANFCQSQVSAFRKGELNLLQEWHQGLSSMPYSTELEKFLFFEKLIEFLSTQGMLTHNFAGVYIACLNPQEYTGKLLDSKELGEHERWVDQEGL